MSKLLWLVPLCVGVSAPILCGQDLLMQSVSIELEQMVEDYVRETLISHRFSNSTDDLEFLFTPKAVDSTHLKHLDAEHRAESVVMQKDKGLSLQGGYAHNFAGALLEEDGIFYNWRTNAGVDWRVFKNGVVARRQTEHQKQLLWQSEKIKRENRLRHLSFQQSSDLVIYTFNKKKIDVIRNRLDILSRLEEVATKMFYMKFLQWEEVLVVRSKKMETQLFLDNYETYQKSVQLSPECLARDVQELPVFDLPFDQIEQAGFDTASQAAILAHELAALDHEFHWSKEVTLNAQLRYNYYQGGPGATYAGRDFLSGGLTVGMPLPFDRSARRQLKEAKKRTLISEFDTQHRNLKNELLKLYHDYEHALKQYVHFYYRKERLAVSIERGMRQKHLEDPNYSPMHVVDKLDELFGVDLELWDVQQQMYLKALEIFDLIGSGDIVPMIELKNYHLFSTRYNGTRAVYCAADELERMETKYLVEFLKFNKFGEVLVDIGGDLNLYLHYAALLDAASQEDFEVRLSFVPSSFAQPVLQELAASVDLALTPRIHLELRHLDPTDQAAVDRITSLLQDRAGSYDIALTVGLTSYGTLKHLEAYATSIDVIAEDSDDLVTLYYPLVHGGHPAAGKTRLLVSTEDFNNRLELDTFLDRLQDHLQMDRVSIDDMGGLMQLERQTIGWNEERGL